MKRDIESREDIELLVNTFYDQVKRSPEIGFFFSDVIAVDWAKHLPIMYSFWESVLLKKASYSGNPMIKHIALDQKEALSQVHFTAWLQLWKKTLHELFEGEKANDALLRAENMATLIQYKVGRSRNSNFIQ